MDKFLKEKYKWSKLTQEEIKNLNSFINFKEIKSVVKNQNQSKQKQTTLPHL